ncbi:hypothetical protein P170DRAFT_477579 [Aspergillus steynii IBT 23096]|uniref:HECT-type E3 ubiquitin transferase n=1 Tax=Aspergillus steynii IBT 23096 TaxID=1392250 RepID=A0A2I2G1E7_9EURO|nr:uncharacterized protein P170DRAFT_477579 [Aspergillus steynii IBT 23096]PLB46704.1 hypothetical protein P170DRAFT_477579 [Aspergillus steynii IBT 23096]
MPSRAPRNPPYPPTSSSPAAPPHANLVPSSIERSAPRLIPQNATGLPSMNANPATSPPHRHGHSRSISHPFPSPFAGAGKRRNRSIPKQDFLDSDDDDDDVTYLPDPLSSSPRKGPPRPVPGEDMTTGKCMTCNCTMRWPRNLKIFRCTECLTVNDLEPYRESNDSSGRGKDGKPPAPAIPRKAISLSVERTRSMADGCISGYLKKLLETPGPRAIPIKSPPDRPFVGQDGLLSLSPKQTSGYLSDPRGVDPRGRSSSASGRPRNMDGTNGSTNPVKPSGQSGPLHAESRDTQTRPRDIPRGDRPAREPGRPFPPESKDSMSRPYIFRALEEYIISSFKGCDCLNNSFTTSQQPLQTTNDNSPSKKKPEATATPSHAHPVFEPDAKTLLLGDLAENSSWWMHDGEGIDTSSHAHPKEKPSSSSRAVSSRSPRINWAELAQWYHSIVTAGSSWVEKWSEMQPSDIEGDEDLVRRELWNAVDLSIVEREIVESRLHLHRTLLKATENLLKRPRRPIKKPEEVRFLLILMANPLLYPSSSSMALYTTATPAPRTDRRPSHPMDAGQRLAPPAAKPASSRHRNGGPGHHSGIVKRILGQLANLSNDCHHYLVSWFSRFSPAQFEKTVDLVGSFVTYRLTRQHGRKRSETAQNEDNSLIPSFSSAAGNTPAELHAAINGRSPNKQNNDKRDKPVVYSDDWQLRAAARVMSLLFTANNANVSRKADASEVAGSTTKYQPQRRGHMVPISTFYNTLLDYSNLVADFEAWESKTAKFSFCQYPFFLSIWAKIHVLEHDARRQMEVKAREAFFNSILSRKAISQYLVLKVRRDCLVEDSLRGVSEVVGSSQEEIKKGLRIEFVGEEGVDAGGLRKEWFLLLVREVFDPHHGLFIYDEDSQYCYFNPYCFESSEQFFLVGVLLGLAIYNSTILDIALPPFAFKKLLAAAPPTGTAPQLLTARSPFKCGLDDLAEYRPTLAKGLRALLDFEGDVADTFCYDFVAHVDRYGEVVSVPLCAGGETRPVTNANRREFVDLYVHYLLDTAVTRQYEPFKRGFFTVCGGNALSLFRPEEIELLVRGSDEALDVASLRAVATYDSWSHPRPETVPAVRWFWDFFEHTQPAAQRKILSFITGSDRIPAMGATSLSIRLMCLGDDSSRYPTARTCFNMLGLYRYGSRERLERMLWEAVLNSEGFGLK